MSDVAIFLFCDTAGSELGDGLVSGFSDDDDRPPKCKWSALAFILK